MNRIFDLLKELGLASNETVGGFFPSVRDRDDISVLRCRESGVIFLSRTDHMDISYYEKKKTDPRVLARGKRVAVPRLQDDVRRAQQFGELVKGSRWLDIGTGNGGILDILEPHAAYCAAVEPNVEKLQSIIARGHNAFASMNDLPATRFDVVTMFHVFEHLTDPIGMLQRMHSILAGDGTLIIEVPHANDFLISFLECKAFHAFTFWSEHLILHTSTSLERFVQKAGFTKVSISGYQRYSLANHLHWLAVGEPGGHEKWRFVDTPGLVDGYRKMLEGIERTDTLIAYVKA